MIARRLRCLRGHWRLMFGFCPSCNSDAPKVDTCWVCEDQVRHVLIEGIDKDYVWERFYARDYR